MARRLTQVFPNRPTRPFRTDVSDLKNWGGRWDLNPRHSEPQSEGSGGSPNDFRGFSTQKGRKREQKRRVFNPSFSQVFGPVKKTTKKRESRRDPSAVTAGRG